MNDIEATLTESYDRHAGKVSAVEGDVADVYRRATRRKRKRRALTAVASVALIGAGVAGIAAVQGRDTSPVAATPGADDDLWYVCDHQLDDGTWQGCVLETPYDNPVWECTDPRTDDLANPDGRVRFAACQPVGDLLPAIGGGACVPVTIDTTVPPPGATAPVIDGPTTLAAGCVPADTVPLTDVPLPTVVCSVPPQATLPAPSTPIATCVADRVLQPVCALPAATTTTSVVVATSPCLPAMPTTTTTLPAERQELIAIGDSIMLSAADTLRERGYFVDAAVTRQMQDAIPVLERLGEQGALGEVVVVHLGANGTISTGMLQDLLTTLQDVPNVILINNRIDRAWAEGNNDLIAAADRPDDNVIVIDWAAKGGECPGDCFAADDIHLNERGAEYYADLIRDVTGT